MKLKNTGGVIKKTVNFKRGPAYDFTFTYGPENWYLTIRFRESIISAGIKVIPGRPLLKTEQGTVFPGRDTSKTGFNEIVIMED